MKGRRSQEKIAKALFKKSLTGTIVDYKKVQLILKNITLQKPPQLVNILKIYKKLIENALAKERVTVESAVKPTNQQKLLQEITKKTGARNITFKINPKIILGAKITHGDWVYDGSLSAKLNKLTKST